MSTGDPSPTSAPPSQHAETIATFRAVTAVDNDEDARRVLELCSWHLDRAVTTYLDNPSILQQQQQQTSTDLISTSAPSSAPSAPLSPPPSSSSPSPSPSPNENGVVQNTGLSFQRLPRWILAVLSPFRFVWSIFSQMTNKLMQLLSGPAFLIESSPGNTPARRFLSFYESQYGTAHPQFYDGSYPEALSQASTQLKFLMVYIHSESHRLTPTLCRQILSDNTLITNLNDSFIVWASSITQRDGAAVHNALRAPTLPYMAILAPPSTGNTPTTTTSDSTNTNTTTTSRIDYSRVQHHGTLLNVRAGATLVSGGVNGILNWIERVTQRHASALESIRLQREERESARLLRQQQDEEFAASLEADRRREREAQAQREAEDAERRRLEEIAVRRERKRQSLGSEPEKGAGIASVMLRLPDGQGVRRRFDQQDVLEKIFDWAEVNGVDIEKASLVMAMPRKTFCYPEDAGMKIGDAGLFPSAMLLLEER